MVYTTVQLPGTSVPAHYIKHIMTKHNQPFNNLREAVSPGPPEPGDRRTPWAFGSTAGPDLSQPLPKTPPDTANKPTEAARQQIAVTFMSGYAETCQKQESNGITTPRTTFAQNISHTISKYFFFQNGDAGKGQEIKITNWKKREQLWDPFSGTHLCKLNATIPSHVPTGECPGVKPVGRLLLWVIVLILGSTIRSYQKYICRRRATE